MISICFIILTYFPKSSRLLQLAKVLSGYPTVIVDNTPHQSVFLEKVSHEFPEIHTICTHKNIGYTGGTTVGLTYAYEKGYEWMVILNDDMELSRKTIIQFVKSLHISKAGILGPWPRSLDSKRWTSQISSYQNAFDFLSGSFLAIHRNVIHKLGYFYIPYFIYYEEVEYCVRAKKIGFPLQWLPLDGVHHEESSSFENLPKLHQYYLARNHLLFVERNSPLKVKIHECIRLPKTIWEHIYKKEYGALEGIRDYFIRRFGPYKGKYV